MYTSPLTWNTSAPGSCIVAKRRLHAAHLGISPDGAIHLSSSPSLGRHKQRGGNYYTFKTVLNYSLKDAYNWFHLPYKSMLHITSRNEDLLFRITMYHCYEVSSQVFTPLFASFIGNLYCPSYNSDKAREG